MKSTLIRVSAAVLFASLPIPAQLGVDDPRVLVLINPWVTRGALVFRHTLGLFLRLLLASADLGGTYFKASSSPS
jgi:hypothetical protein